MKLQRYLFTLAALLVLMTASGQCRFCYTYEDFLNDTWEQLDTVFVSQHSKSHQAWWGGNDYTLSTGNRSQDKTLKNNAFIVMQADTMFINCRSLRYEGTNFGNGYTRAMRIGNRSILLVNRLIGKEVKRQQQTTAFMFGAIGAAIAAGKQNKQQVCYVISNGADEKGRINIRLINDSLMDQMIEGQNSLLNEYYSVLDEEERQQATHIVPILEKAGLFGGLSVEQVQ